MARALTHVELAVACVIASACVDVKDGTFQDVCPVKRIYEGGRMTYTQPDECTDYGCNGS